MRVDDEVMRMGRFAMAVRMRVRLGAFPSLMFVIVMIVMEVKMIVNERPVSVRRFQRIGGRPNQAGDRAERQRAAAHDHERSLQSQ